MSIFHCMNEDLLFESFQRIRKDGAPGIDKQTGKEYSENLGQNLRLLDERIRSGRYRAPAVRRVMIPKSDGGERMLGIPTFEDKIVQRAVVTLLEAIYEPEFLPCSYGFRPGKSAHQALADLRQKCIENRVITIIDADIKGCFDNIDHKQLKEVMKQRVVDGQVHRFVGKWLNAGVLDGKILIHPESGTPQGGVISPMLANIFLHTVLDEWWHEQVQPRLKGKSFLIRYADDFVIGFELEEDAHKVFEVLPKRFSKYGLTIHPEKTRLVRFGKPTNHRRESETFDFLGFTHYWDKAKKGFWVIKRKTAKKRLQKAFTGIWQWCKSNRHDPLPQQHRTFCSKLRGHYNYYGVRCNYLQMERLYQGARRAWKFWLSRRGNKTPMNFATFSRIEKYFPLPKPRIIHAI